MNRADQLLKKIERNIAELELCERTAFVHILHVRNCYREPTERDHRRLKEATARREAEVGLRDFLIRQREAGIMVNFTVARVEEIRGHWLAVDDAQRRIVAIPDIDEFLPVLRMVYPEIFHAVAEEWPQRLVDATANGVSLENFRQLADKWVSDYTDAINRVRGKRASDGRS